MKKSVDVQKRFPDIPDGIPNVWRLLSLSLRYEGRLQHSLKWRMSRE